MLLIKLAKPSLFAGCFLTGTVYNQHTVVKVPKTTGMHWRADALKSKPPDKLLPLPWVFLQVPTYRALLLGPILAQRV